MSAPSSSSSRKPAPTVVTLAQLNQRPGLIDFTQTEQNSVHHSLYTQISGSTQPSSPVATPKDVSATSADNSPLPASSASASAEQRAIQVSVRANNLLPPSWLSETTSCIALFRVNENTPGAASSSSSSSKYELIGQTEVVSEQNSPVYTTQFTLDRNPSSAAARNNYMLRVYDADQTSETIDENNYQGLTTFNIEEIIANSRQHMKRTSKAASPRSAAQNGGSSGGEFIDIHLPLINPLNKEWNEQLVAEHSSITLSLHIPYEDAEESTNAVVPSSSSSISQAIYTYTRLINYHTPNLSAIFMNLNIKSSVNDAATKGDLISVWYRTRSTAAFQFLTYILNEGEGALTAEHTLILSNELALAAGNELELKVCVHASKRLVGGQAHALATGRIAERTLSKSVNATTATSASSSSSSSRAPSSSSQSSDFLGSVTFPFKTLFAQLDKTDLDLSLSTPASSPANSAPGSASASPQQANRKVGGGAAGAAVGKIQLSLTTRQKVDATSTKKAPSSNAVSPSKNKQISPQPSGASNTNNSVPPSPSLSASTPASVLQKAHDLIQAGLYFTQFLSQSADEEHEDQVDEVKRRDLFIRLIDGKREGKGKPTRLSWSLVTSKNRSANVNPASLEEEGYLELSAINNIYGGVASSPIFFDHIAAGHSLPPHDTLFSLSSSNPASGGILSLQASSWQTRDTFIFSLLSYQGYCGLTNAQWHPIGTDAAQSKKKQPKIVNSSSKDGLAGMKNGNAAGSVSPASTTTEQRSTVISPRPTSANSSNTTTTTTTTAVAASSTAAVSSSAASSPSPAAPSSASASTSVTASPASSSGTASPASEPSAELSEVLMKLEKLFEQGRNFVRFTSGGVKPCYVSVFLRKEPVSATDSRQMFSLYWCAADTRSESLTRSLRCDEIIGIALGKQTSVFRKPEASLSPASHCFSIIGSNKSLHLQTWNERDADTYSFGIASLIKNYGTTKPRLWQQGQYTEALNRSEIENASELKEENDGTQTIEPRDIPTLANAAQGYKCNIELSIKCKNLPSKHSNHIVCVFDRDEKTEKLTYLAQTEKQARPHNPEFRKVFRLTYDSTEARKLRFNVYDIPPSHKQMDDEDRMGSAMMLLSEVVDGAGIEFVYKLTHETPQKQQLLQKNGATIVIQCSAKSEMTMETSPQRPLPPTK